MPPFPKHLAILNLPSQPLGGYYPFITVGEIVLGKLTNFLKASEFLRGVTLY